MTDDILPENLTVTVFVMEHDDDEVRYVVNTRTEMLENYDDFLDEINQTILVRTPGSDTPVEYDASRVYKMTDPVAYDADFLRYCQGWTELEMPWDVYFGDDDAARIAWVEKEVSK